MPGTVLSRTKQIGRHAGQPSIPLDVQSPDGLMVRVRPWPNEPSTAFLQLRGAHDTHTPMPRHEVISGWLTRIRALGFERVRTSAVSPRTQEVLEEHGFHVAQQLTMLSAELSADTCGRSSFVSDGRVPVPRHASRVMRRVLGFDNYARVLQVDAAAFGTRWCLDHVELRHAIRATERSRLFTTGHRDVDAFVVVSATNRTGFLQRLAVRPAVQSMGHGTALLRRALQWLHSQQCTTAYVNTEHTNTPALSLYASHGFTIGKSGLAVLELPLEVSMS